MPDGLPYLADAEVFVATLARVAATEGDAMAVAVLAESDPAITLEHEESNWGDSYRSYVLRLVLAADLYGRLGTDRAPLAKRLAALAEDVSRAHDNTEIVGSVVLAPALQSADGWRDGARAWLRGEGINNQGRVRSDNIAARQHDGLLFRSQPEIHLYDALKATGVYLAPLPVFLRGGKHRYRRLEPDFVIIAKGVTMVVEVDGATVHRESPAEAHERVEGLLQEGVRVERVAADQCDSAEKASQCAARLIEKLERYRALRGG